MTLVVYVGHAEHKHWWRSFADGDRCVNVRLRGVARPALGRVLDQGDPGHAAAAAVYRGGHPRVTLVPDATLVLIRLG